MAYNRVPSFGVGNTIMDWLGAAAITIGAVLAAVLTIGVFLLPFALPLTIVYIVWHFAAKFW